MPYVSTSTSTGPPAPGTQSPFVPPLMKSQPPPGWRPPDVKSVRKRLAGLGQGYIPFLDPLSAKIIQAIVTPGPEDIAKVVQQFPVIMKQARSDWAKYEVGSKNNLFTKGQSRDIVDWFAQLPYLWDGIKNNWLFTPQGLLLSGANKKFYDDTESWMNKLRTSPSVLFPGIGFGFLIIAGVIILAAFGTAGAFWAIGYVKKQNNISRMIDEVVAGRLPPEVLQAAVDKEESGFLGDIKGIVMLGLGVAALYLFWPQIKTLAKR